MSPDQARTAAALADLLTAEAALFDELSDLSGMQRRALARAAEAELAQAASRAETLATRFRLLEEERGRIESFVPEGERRVAEARVALARALGRLLREMPSRARSLNVSATRWRPARRRSAACSPPPTGPTAAAPRAAPPAPAFPRRAEPWASSTTSPSAGRPWARFAKG